jgi:hypothetical protein
MGLVIGKLARTKQTARNPRHGEMADKGPASTQESDEEEAEAQSSEEEEPPILVKFQKIGDFKKAGGDYRAGLWRLYKHEKTNSMYFYKGPSATGEYTPGRPKTIRSWTLGSGKNKKSCLVFNEKFVVSRELLDIEYSNLDCKGKIIDIAKVDGRKAAGISFLLFCNTHS